MSTVSNRTCKNCSVNPSTWMHLSSLDMYTFVVWDSVLVTICPPWSPLLLLFPVCMQILFTASLLYGVSRVWRGCVSFEKSVANGKCKRIKMLALIRWAALFLLTTKIQKSEGGGVSEGHGEMRNLTMHPAKFSSPYHVNWRKINMLLIFNPVFSRALTLSLLSLTSHPKPFQPCI